MLQNGHSLIKLCKKSSEYDAVFKKYIKDCAVLNEYSIEARYPAEDPLIADKEDVEDSMKITENITNYIKSKMK